MYSTNKLLQNKIFFRDSHTLLLLIIYALHATYLRTRYKSFLEKIKPTSEIKKRAVSRPFFSHLFIAA